MLPTRRTGGFGLNHVTEANLDPDKPVRLALFQDFENKILADETIIYREYMLKVAPHWSGKDKRKGIDIAVTVPNLRGNVKAQFAIQQPGNQKFTFHFIFTPTRNNFVWRRALTIPKLFEDDGTEKEAYSSYRFLRSREDDEPVFEQSHTSDTRPRIPLQWVKKREKWVQIDNNRMFNTCFARFAPNAKLFEYNFFVEHFQYSNTDILQYSMVWPKADFVAKYRAGVQVALDSNWFTSAWKNFREVMSNLHYLPPDMYADLIDILGRYYHGWDFDCNRLLALVKCADRLGFFDYTDMCISDKLIDCYTASARAFLIPPINHPFAARNDAPDLVGDVLFHHDSIITAPLILNVDQGKQPYIFEIDVELPTKTMDVTINMDRKWWSGVEYLQLKFMVMGDMAPDEHQLWTVHMTPILVNAPLMPVSVTRYLNYVERTMCIPTAFLWQDIQFCFNNGPFHFRLKVELRSVMRHRIGRMSPLLPTISVQNRSILCKSNLMICGINTDFLGHMCENLRVNPVVGEDGKPVDVNQRDPYDIFKKFEHQDVLNFLDMLFHGSKVLHHDMWEKLFKIADDVDCSDVIDYFEAGMIRAKMFTSMRDLKIPLFQKFIMPEMQFSIKLKERLDIPTIDEHNDFIDQIFSGSFSEAGDDDEEEDDEDEDEEEYDDEEEDENEDEEESDPDNWDDYSFSDSEPKSGSKSEAKSESN